MTEPHPEIGEQVYYFDPTLTQKAGYGRGYGTPGMGVGPYIAQVANNKPGVTIQVHVFIPEMPPYPVTLRHKNDVSSPKDPYWDWKDHLQKARAVKRQIPAEPPPPERDRTRHPGSPVRVEA